MKNEMIHFLNWKEAEKKQLNTDMNRGGRGGFEADMIFFLFSES